jgi:hypothetical protein
MYVGLCVALIASRQSSRPAPAVVQSSSPAAGVGPKPPGPPTAGEWFRRAKPYCNAVEVATLAQRMEPPPATAEGTGYHAACFALAGRIDDARRLIDQLAARERLHAANVVFEVGHPVADAGDDRSAGPIMELVIDYWPNHYMALYHAGMAEYMLGQRDLARHNLEAFLNDYHENDGWRTNALDVLRRMSDSTHPSADLRRPREPRE